MKEIKFKIIGQCPYTNRYFVQFIYRKEDRYAKIADFCKSIGVAKEITNKIFDGYGDIMENDLERFTAAEKIKEESDTSMTPSDSTSTQVIFAQPISFILFIGYFIKKYSKIIF